MHAKCELRGGSFCAKKVRCPNVSTWSANASSRPFVFSYALVILFFAEKRYSAKANAKMPTPRTAHIKVETISIIVVSP